MSDVLFEQQIGSFRFVTHDGRPDLEVMILKQVHGIQLVSNKNKIDDLTTADGFLFKKGKMDYIPCIRTADCVPILVIGVTGHAFLHAGWRGINAGIVTQKAIQNLKPQFVFLGPHIKDCCYEVGQEFLQYFPSKSSFVSRNGKLFFSMEREIKRQLHGVKVESAEACTSCDRRFHSFRRDKDQARNWNVIL